MEMCLCLLPSSVVCEMEREREGESGLKEKGSSIDFDAYCSLFSFVSARV